MNYTYQNPKITKSNNPKEENKIVRMTPKEMLNIGVDYQAERFSGELIGAYVSKKYAEADNGDIVTVVPGAYDPVFLVNLNLSYKFNERNRVELGVYNALDRDYYNSSLGQGGNYLATYTYSC